MSLAARVGDQVGSHGSAAASAAARGAAAGASVFAGASAASLAQESGARSAGGSGAPCGRIGAGASTVIIEGMAVARAGDVVGHGAATLKEGSATVFVNGRPVSRDGDASTCGGHVVTHARFTVIGGPSSANAARGGGGGDVSSNVAAMLAGMARAEREMAAERGAGEPSVQLVDAGPTAMSTAARALAARTAAADDALQSARTDVGAAMTERTRAQQAVRDAVMNGGDVSAARARFEQANADLTRATALTRASAVAEDDAVRAEVTNREQEVYGPNGPTAMQRVGSGAAFTGSFVGSALVNAPSAVVDSGVGLATGAWQVVRHPVDTAQSVANVFTRPADPAEDARALDASERQGLAQSRSDRLQMVDDPSGAGAALGKMVDDVIVGPMILGGLLGKVGGALLGRVAKRGGAAADANAAVTEAEACRTCAAKGKTEGPPPPDPPPPPPKELMTDAERMARAKELFPGLQGHGTCSLMSCAQIIEQATGVRLGEAEMMKLGERVGAYDPRVDGTHGDRIPDVLREAGVPAHLEEPTMENVQKALDEGKGVITSHDIETFGGHPIPDDGGGHSVMPVAVMRNSSGGMTSVRLNDTGNGSLLTAKSPKAFSNSLTGLVVTDDPIWVK